MSKIFPHVVQGGTVALTSVFVLLLILEHLRPLRRWKRGFLHRYFINFCFSAVAFVVGMLIVRPVSLGLSGTVSAKGFGLLHFTGLPVLMQFVIGFLLMDLTFYYWHRANHEIPLLWRFHNVHHVDPDLDVTTSFRFHFVEILYSTCFRVVQVGLIGVSPMTYATYELFFQGATMFHHSNVELPIQTERMVNKFIVTPRMHGIHHSTVREETNSNYSVIFRWWDSVHRSLRLNVSQAHIEIGVPAYLNPGDNSVFALVALPFRKQREYWVLADGRDSRTETGSGEHDRSFLQE